MGTYQRKGHYRRSKNGTLHWVSPHRVTRDDFGRSGTSHPPPQWDYRFKAPPRPPPPVRIPQPYSARWAQPNAMCPVCGALVYFWSNAYGSRVFFDEMGPPWPKHPCTDIRQLSTFPAWSAPTWNRSSPTYPSQAMTQGQPLSAAGYRRRYGLRAAKAFVLLAYRRVQGGTELRLRRESWIGRTVKLYARGFPALPIGQLAFVDKDQLTYLDPVHLNVLQIQVLTRKRFAKGRY